MCSRVLAVCSCLLVSACAGDRSSSTTQVDSTSTSGDGDPGGDGDGDSAPTGDGDGDGDPTGDGDGDGDGDPTGDGDGDGDGDPTGDGDGDGDGDPSGDGDGDEGFGTIVGECGLIADELDALTPSLFVLHFDFRDDPYDDPEDLPLLSEGAQTILTQPNAGGSSTISEAFAFEILARCEGALLLETENDIDYDPVDSKKTDIAVEIDSLRVGVSVTRAVGFPPEDPYTVDQAQALLDDKLADILISSANVVPEQAWVKQVLVVMAYADMHAASLEAALAEIDAMTQADTIVYMVVTDGIDTPVYFE